MHVSMNADWARFKALGIARLGRAGFADWMRHATDVVSAEARREAIDAIFSERTHGHPGAITDTVTP